MPVFVANGESDPMILPHYSYLLPGLIPHAHVKIYPDAVQGSCSSITPSSPPTSTPFNPVPARHPQESARTTDADMRFYDFITGDQPLPGRLVRHDPTSVGLRSVVLGDPS